MQIGADAYFDVAAPTRPGEVAPAPVESEAFDTHLDAYLDEPAHDPADHIDPDHAEPEAEAYAAPPRDQAPQSELQVLASLSASEPPREAPVDPGADTVTGAEGVSDAAGAAPQQTQAGPHAQRTSGNAEAQSGAQTATAQAQQSANAPATTPQSTQSAAATSNADSAAQPTEPAQTSAPTQSASIAAPSDASVQNASATTTAPTHTDVRAAHTVAQAQAAQPAAIQNAATQTPPSQRAAQTQTASATQQTSTNGAASEGQTATPVQTGADATTTSAQAQSAPAANAPAAAQATRQSFNLAALTTADVAEGDAASTTQKFDAATAPAAGKQAAAASKSAAASAQTAPQGAGKESGFAALLAPLIDSGAQTASQTAPTHHAPAPGAVDAAAQTSHARAELSANAHTTPAAAQVSREIIRRFNGDSTRFEMRLDPPDLGRVEVRMEVSRDNRVTAVVAADSPQALSELSRHARDLEQALNAAGLELSENGLSFDLTQQREQMADLRDGQTGARAGAADAGETQSEARTARLERWQGVRVDLVA